MSTASQRPSNPDSDAMVYLVDDDADARVLLCCQLTDAGFSIGAFASAEQFLEGYDPDAPGCLVLDMRMPGMSGLELQARMGEHGIRTPIIFLTAFAEVGSVVHAMEAGAVTVLEKPFHRQELIDRITRALEHDTEERRHRAHHSEAEARMTALTPRERQVVSMVAAGKSTKQIAAELGTSPRTIDVHRAHMMKKLRVHSLADLVVIAVECQSYLSDAG